MKFIWTSVMPNYMSAHANACMLMVVLWLGFKLIFKGIFSVYSICMNIQTSLEDG